MKTLTRLLPRLKPSDALLLTAQHHSELNRLLNHKIIMKNPTERAFARAILRACEQVGGPQDLPTVTRLANGEGYAKRNSDIRKAAQECLPYLQARSDGQESRQTLLRALSGTADNPANLLRPAAATDERVPRQLLRPAEPNPPQAPPS